MAYRYQTFRLTHIWIIMAVNLLLFVATLVVPNFIYEFLGLRTAGFLLQPWTVITSLFVHSGFWHIIANMVTLYFFGTYLSMLVGTKRFLTVYFCGGVLGNIFFILAGLTGLISPFTTVVGASGAIFAVGGALAVMRPRLRVLVFFFIPAPLWAAIIGGFIILSFAPFIAWQAHLGGLVFGLIAGYFFRRKERRYYV